MRDRAGSGRCEQARVERTLHVDAEDERRARGAHHEDVETRQHSDPDVHLEQHTSETCGLRPVEEHAQVMGVCHTRCIVRVLMVEDDATIADFVSKGLAEAGHAVDVASDGEKGVELALKGGYDAAIVDVMLPRLDGLTLIDRLRARGVQTPVLILSARRTVDDRVKGLQAGGDDYLTKPFAFAELLARLQALIRRSTGQTEPTRLSLGNLSLDLLSRRAERDGKPIDLRPREYGLLEYLLRNQGRVLTKTMILSHVWGYNFDPGTNVVDVLVSRLREKIDRDFEPKLLHTVRGVGYVLKAS